MAALCLAYIISGKLGLKLAFVHASATAVWPPTGIALAAFLTLGYGFWPAVLLGAFVVNLTTAGTIATSLGIAAGNTLEGVVGCFLVTRFANGRNAFARAQDTFKFVFAAGLVATAVSATIGVTTISLGGIAPWKDYGTIWITWWLGDAVGALVVAPLLILWTANPRVRWSGRQAAEAYLLSMTLFLLSWSIFSGGFHLEIKNYPLEFLCIPPVIWAAFRFGRRAAVTAVAGLSVVATWGTLHGFGPFVAKSQNDSLLMVQLFLAILAVMGLVLAAAALERNRMAAKFALAVQSAPNAMVMVDRKGKIVLVNSQGMKMFGYTEEELVGQSVEVLVPLRFRGGHSKHRGGFYAHPQTRPMGAGRDLYAVRKDGSEFPVEIGLNPIKTEDGPFVLSAIVDITARKAAEEEIRRLAASDPLTGLANYRRLMDVLDAEGKRSDRSERQFAVLLIDVDGLKNINDELGHLTGSRALCRVANVLRVHCRDIDTAARFGGDEFALVLPESGENEAHEVARRIGDRLANDGEQPALSVSVGAAVYPRHGETVEKLLAAADRDLYAMKRRQRGESPLQAGQRPRRPVN